MGFSSWYLFKNPNLSGLFQVKGDEYMTVNHEENHAVTY